MVEVKDEADHLVENEFKKLEEELDSQQTKTKWSVKTGKTFILVLFCFLTLQLNVLYLPAYMIQLFSRGKMFVNFTACDDRRAYCEAVLSLIYIMILSMSLHFIAFSCEWLKWEYVEVLFSVM